MVCLAWLAACEESSGQAPAEVPQAAPVGELSYRLDWSWGQAEPSSDGVGWEVVTDLGYKVVVEEGFLVTYSMEVVECDPVIPEGFGAWLWKQVGPGVAWAGHSGLAENPAAIRVSRVESLTSPKALVLGPLELAPQRYCNIHYLVARADEDTLELPTEVDLDRVSVYIRGSWQAPDSAAAVPFQFETALAAGVLFDLFPLGAFDTERSGVEFDTSLQGAQVVITRDLGRFFDGLDFVETEGAALERALLRTFMQNTRIEVELWGQ